MKARFFSQYKQLFVTLNIIILVANYMPPATRGYMPPATRGYMPPATKGYMPPATTGR